MAVSSRFRPPKSAEEEEICVENSTPKSTQYKNKWAAAIFELWQKERCLKVATIEPGGLFKDYELYKVQQLDVPLIDMDALSANYWLTKFVQEVAKPSKERYPPKTVYQIVCGIRRYLAEKKLGSDCYNFLDPSDKRFSIFRRALDAEMKEGTRLGHGLQSKKAEKTPVAESEEKTFWDMGLLGNKTAKSLLNVVYYYNGKLFGLRGGEHRNICLNNFEIGDNYIRFEENVSKTFHGGLQNLRYEPRVVRHVCHKMGETHEPCLVEYYRLYIGLVQSIGKGLSAFYFRPNAHKLAFDRSPVGINTLNRILPDMCNAAGVSRKTAHSLRVTCASTLFNEGIDTKLIRDRTGHRSDALAKYEKPNEKAVCNVSAILGPKCSTATIQSTEDGSNEVAAKEVLQKSLQNVPLCLGNISNCTKYQL